MQIKCSDPSLHVILATSDQQILLFSFSYLQAYYFFICI